MPLPIHRAWGLCLAFLLSASLASAQQTWLSVPDSLNRARFWGLTATTAVGYTGVSLYLDQIWYAQYPRGAFRSFDDRGEWLDMDKMGHFYTAYLYSYWGSRAYRWTGLRPRQAMWAGVIISTTFQTTVEIMDGFSEEWGFSWADVAMNTAGTATFAGQELLWGEQRIVAKFSSWQRPAPDYMVLSSNGGPAIPLQSRYDYLFGTNPVEGLLKNYNASTMWLSANIASFLPEDTRFPKWLNVAVGYGGSNIYGAFGNSWEEGGYRYRLPASDFPRTSQYYLSLDVDLTKIRTRSPFLNGLFDALNVIKFPAPALEYNSQGQWRWHGIYF